MMYVRLLAVLGFVVSALSFITPQLEPEVFLWYHQVIFYIIGLVFGIFSIYIFYTTIK